jgi:predicted ATPase
MLESIELHNFKSARDLYVRLAPLTVLTGLNGSGKSTVLQALALLKQSLVANAVTQELVLRGALIRLGHCEDVRFENATDDEIAFVVKTPNGQTRLSAPAVAGIDILQLRSDGDADDVIAQFESGFQFIQADRITPAVQYKQASTVERANGWLGCGGEYTVDFLERNQDMKVSPGRLFPRDHPTLTAELLKQVAPTESLLDQTSGWLQHLSPGVRPRAVPVELADAASLQFSYTGTSLDSESRSHRAANVGFGLTYCLPIIVACLGARAGALLLLENPEAHLHPRGQSALGLLLARCAMDGVQIIVETHSDHVLNGIRLAAKRNEISSDGVAVHFFSRNVESGESTITSPVLHSNGRFSEWPDGFFDEWSKALDELLDN